MVNDEANEMARVMHPDSQVDEPTRMALKTAIDNYGRLGFCKMMGLSYMQVSNHLNGATTLRKCVADYYRDSLSSIRG